LADFDGLIRQALASQNAADPATRERIYQSSRRALAKMLEKAGNLSNESVRQHFANLEASIGLIEADFAPPPAEPEPPAPPPDLPPEPLAQPQPEIFVEPTAAPAGYTQPEPAPRPEPSPVPPRPEPEPEVRLSQLRTEAPAPRQPAPQQQPAPRQASPSVLRQEPAFDAPFEDQSVNANPPENVEAYLGDVTPEAPTHGKQATHYQGEVQEEFTADPPPTYRRKNPLMRRIWPIFLALAVIAVILWILYALLANMPEATTNNPNADIPGPVGQLEQTEDGSILITLLEPTDLSALTTAGRGSAELITEQKRPVLRLQSLRQGGLNEVSAQPILLELEKGVLQQVAGKEVTVEFLAKSGTSGPAQFSVECDVGGDSVCGRKRFRVGLQPERIVFSMSVRDDLPANSKAYLAINTDITNAANATGEGDLIDILYVRLRIAPPA